MGLSFSRLMSNEVLVWVVLEKWLASTTNSSDSLGMVCSSSISLCLRACRGVVRRVSSRRVARIFFMLIIDGYL